MRPMTLQGQWTVRSAALVLPDGRPGIDIAKPALAIRYASGERFCSGDAVVPGKQVVDAASEIVGNAGDGVLQRSFGADTAELGSLDKAVDGGSALTTVVGAGEQRVFLPSATPRSARSAALLSISRRPSSTYRLGARQQTGRSAWRRAGRTCAAAWARSPRAKLAGV